MSTCYSPLQCPFADCPVDVGPPGVVLGRPKQHRSSKQLIAHMRHAHPLRQVPQGTLNWLQVAQCTHCMVLITSSRPHQCTLKRQGSGHQQQGPPERRLCLALGPAAPQLLDAPRASGLAPMEVDPPASQPPLPPSLAPVQQLTAGAPPAPPPQQQAAAAAPAPLPPQRAEGAAAPPQPTRSAYPERVRFGNIPPRASEAFSQATSQAVRAVLDAKDNPEECATTLHRLIVLPRQVLSDPRGLRGRAGCVISCLQRVQQGRSPPTLPPPTPTTGGSEVNKRPWPRRCNASSAEAPSGGRRGAWMPSRSRRSPRRWSSSSRPCTQTKPCRAAATRSARHCRHGRHTSPGSAPAAPEFSAGPQRLDV